MNKATKQIKNALVINGVTYKAVRTNNIAGLGPEPCSLCDKKVKKLCQDRNTMPCDLFHKGYMLAHFVKI